MERGLVSVDDLLDTLTRIASLAENAQYRVRRQGQAQALYGSHLVVDSGVDCVARFEQIRDEALDAYERAERGDVSAGSNE